MNNKLTNWGFLHTPPTNPTGAILASYTSRKYKYLNYCLTYQAFAWYTTHMNDQITLGTFLKAEREKNSLSLRAVEEKTGVSNAYISQIENDKIKQPSPNILLKFSELYNISYNDLLELAGHPRSDEIENNIDSSFAARLGNVTDEEQEALLDYLEFLRSRRSRKE